MPIYNPYMTQGAGVQAAYGAPQTQAINPYSPPMGVGGGSYYSPMGYGGMQQQPYQNNNFSPDYGMMAQKKEYLPMGYFMNQNEGTGSNVQSMLSTMYGGGQTPPTPEVSQELPVVNEEVLPPIENTETPEVPIPSPEIIDTAGKKTPSERRNAEGIRLSDPVREQPMMATVEGGRQAPSTPPAGMVTSGRQAPEPVAPPVDTSTMSAIERLLFAANSSNTPSPGSRSSTVDAEQGAQFPMQAGLGGRTPVVPGQNIPVTTGQRTLNGTTPRLGSRQSSGANGSPSTMKKRGR